MNILSTIWGLFLDSCQLGGHRNVSSSCKYGLQMITHPKLWRINTVVIQVSLADFTWWLGTRRSYVSCTKITSSDKRDNISKTKKPRWFYYMAKWREECWHIEFVWSCHFITIVWLKNTLGKSRQVRFCWPHKRIRAQVHERVDQGPCGGAKPPQHGW